MMLLEGENTSKASSALSYPVPAPFFATSASTLRPRFLDGSLRLCALAFLLLPALLPVWY